MVCITNLSSASLDFREWDTSFIYASFSIILFAYKVLVNAPGEKEESSEQPTLFPLRFKKKKKVSPPVSSCALYKRITSHGLSVPLNLYNIFTTCPVMVVGLVHKKKMILKDIIMNSF